MPEWPRFDDKQRLNEEGEAFIKSQTTGALVTIGADGYPHATPLGFYRVGDDLYMSGRRRTQRVVNIERNPKVCFLVEAGSKMSDYRGLIIRGDAEVISDDAEKLRVARAGAQQR
ncbi:MAG: pyridoxamine 5'-phosphate oxidase family protein, partial [Tepidiformaceae bacterium]